MWTEAEKTNMAYHKLRLLARGVKPGKSLDSEHVTIMNRTQEAIRSQCTKDTQYKALRDYLKASQTSADNEANTADVTEENPEEEEYRRNLETTVSELIQVLKGGGICT